MPADPLSLSRARGPGSTTRTDQCGRHRPGRSVRVSTRSGPAGPRAAHPYWGVDAYGALSHRSPAHQVEPPWRCAGHLRPAGRPGAPARRKRSPGCSARPVTSGTGTHCSAMLSRSCGASATASARAGHHRGVRPAAVVVLDLVLDHQVSGQQAGLLVGLAQRGLARRLARGPRAARDAPGVAVVAPDRPVLQEHQRAGCDDEQPGRPVHAPVPVPEGALGPPVPVPQRPGCCIRGHGGPDCQDAGDAATGRPVPGGRRQADARSRAAQSGQARDLGDLACRPGRPRSHGAAHPRAAQRAAGAVPARVPRAATGRAAGRAPSDGRAPPGPPAPSRAGRAPRRPSSPLLSSCHRD